MTIINEGKYLEFMYSTSTIEVNETMT